MSQDNENSNNDSSWWWPTSKLPTVSVPQIPNIDLEKFKTLHTQAFDYWVDKMMDSITLTANKISEKKGNLRDVTITSRLKIGAIELSVSAKLPENQNFDNNLTDVKIEKRIVNLD